MVDTLGALSASTSENSGEVSITLGVIDAVSYNEAVLYRESHVVALYLDLPSRPLVYEGADLEGTGVSVESLSRTR